MSIRLLSHKDIDLAKWDDCITRFYNGCVYAYSWYLDRICDHWIALVEDEYETVMPLPVSELNGKKIIDQPTMARYLGLFTNKQISSQMIQEYFRAIPEEFQYVSLVLNKFNNATDLPENYSVSKYLVYSVDLISSYTKLSHHYTRRALEMIHVANNQKMVVLSGIQPREFMSFFTKNLQKSSHKLQDKDVRRLRSIISHSLFHNFGEIMGAYDVSNNLMATVFFLGSHQKISACLCIQSPQEHSTAALYLLYDHFIKKHAEKNIVLSFETTSLVKEKNNLYLDLGAFVSDCMVVKKNKLPLWQRWMK